MPLRFDASATTEIYTLSLHDALPIYEQSDPTRDLPLDQRTKPRFVHLARGVERGDEVHEARDRKSTRLNSSHANISYAVFCLKKKKYGISTCRSSRSACGRRSRRPDI